MGSGKTALMLQLCLKLRDKMNIAAVTNDIFTKEDGEFLTKHGALPAERIRAVETGGCPNDPRDISANLLALEELHAKFQPQLCSSSNPVATISPRVSVANWRTSRFRSLMSAVATKFPQGGPGITQTDLLVINKTDPPWVWARI